MSEATRLQDDIEPITSPETVTDDDIDRSADLSSSSPKKSFVEGDTINNILDNATSSRIRGFNRKSSVILPSTGERVHRSLSFMNTSFESFNSNINLEAQPSMRNLNNSELASSMTMMGRVKSAVHNTVVFLHDVYNNEAFKSVLKCSIAYTIASLGVYWSPFDKFLGDTDFKHVVATVAVYFHPSRSKGSMHITLFYVTVSLFFSFVVSFLCRYVSTGFFNDGKDQTSYFIDLIVSSSALGLVAFMKQKVNKETFNTACSLASISIVACIIKEGSMNSSVIPIERLNATIQVVVVGCLVSVVICYVLWPVTATQNLRASLNESYNIMSALLSVLTNRFLTGDKITAKDNEMFNQMNKNISSLKKNLQESKYEMYMAGQESEWKILKQLVEGTITLFTHLRALRSSTEMQYDLLSESLDTSPDNRSPSVSTSIKSYKSDIMKLSQSVENLDKINSSTQRPGDNSELDYVAINSGQLFDLFVYYLAPSMKAFVFTIKNILGEVPFENYDRSANYENFIKTAKFQKSLSIAIDLFEDKQTNSFQKLYNQEIFKSNTDFLFKSNLEEVTACCGNFSSLMKLFAKELHHFLVLMEVYEKSVNGNKSWKWVKFWRKAKEPSSKDRSSQGHNLSDALIFLQSQYRLSEPETRQNEKSILYSWSYQLWKYLSFLKRTDIQFGIRVGLGAFVLSLSAFFPATKFLFNNWRGEWSLTIYCIMMNKSLGGTTMTVKWRFLGTFLGAFFALVVWKLFDAHPFALCLAGFLLSLPCFNIILYWTKNNAFGRFILLTYNLTALYSYSMVQHDGEDDNEGGDSPIVTEIAFHRFISVSVGIIWALFMASVFIPNSARSRLKSGFTALWLRMGVIWLGDPLEFKEDDRTNELKLVGLKDDGSVDSVLNELELLLKQAPLEFRLKGKFPKEEYEKLVNATSNIINSYHNMSSIIECEPVLSSNEYFVIQYIESERHELEHRIFLIFYMVASAMKLGLPLPSKPASTEHAKDRLLYKLSEIRTKSSQDDGDHVVLSNEDYVLLYSYILVTTNITDELDKIIDTIKILMGDISEELFQLV